MIMHNSPTIRHALKNQGKETTQGFFARDQVPPSSNPCHVVAGKFDLKIRKSELAHLPPF
jgi:hypothetical protein